MDDPDLVEYIAKAKAIRKAEVEAAEEARRKKAAQEKAAYLEVQAAMLHGMSADIPTCMLKSEYLSYGLYDHRDSEAHPVLRLPGCAPIMFRMRRQGDAWTRDRDFGWRVPELALPHFRPPYYRNSFRAIPLFVSAVGYAAELGVQYAEAKAAYDARPPEPADEPPPPPLEVEDALTTAARVLVDAIRKTVQEASE